MTGISTSLVQPKSLLRRLLFFSRRSCNTLRNALLASPILREGSLVLSFFGLYFSLSYRLNTLGYRVGIRAFELMSWRNESSSKAPKREIRFLPALMSIHTQVWRTLFGKPADAIEKSVENADECMSHWYFNYPQFLTSRKI